ncbi:Glutamyl-tRNA amidotransferase subunit A, mitochondrial [Auriculariales sp. MPI-PUGE-AT-0066]|nr:Glutamyl-tRNA amidotransferase subunit A, mitochondrial [Auriculariales sp. MPI-PUGE-AT-0066]
MHLTRVLHQLALDASSCASATSLRALNAFVSPVRQEPKDVLSVAVKDNICTKDWNTTCGSNALRNFRSPFDASVVTFLNEADVPIIGKTNLDEFGMGSLNMHTIHGPVLNPHGNLPRAAGGSSGGSAAAVAAGLCSAALGTDTGGSVRLPASYCGVYGLKPSYGLVSRWGVVAYADSLDCVGVLSKTVRDLRRVFEIICRPDTRDSTCATVERRSRVSGLQRERFNHPTPSKSLNGIRVETKPMRQEYFPEEVDNQIINVCRDTLARLRTLGATIVPVSLPSTRYALSAYYVIASAEASSNLARYDGVRYGTCIPPSITSDRTRAASVYALSRSAGFGTEVQKRLLLGTYALTAEAFDNYFLQATRVRAKLVADFDRVFALPNCRQEVDGQAVDNTLLWESPNVDLLVHPSAIRTAPKLDELAQMNPLDAYVQDVLTVPASLAGLPALNIPAGHGSDTCPVGVSLVGQWGADGLLLDVAEVLARAGDEKLESAATVPVQTLEQ